MSDPLRGLGPRSDRELVDAVQRAAARQGKRVADFIADTLNETPATEPGTDVRGIEGAHSADHHEIFLIRHGATEWSRNGRHTGHTDLPLLPEGRDRAADLAKLLADRKFAMVLVSPLSRARDTCELAGYGEVAEVEPDLIEWDYGDYEGVTTKAIRENHPGWTVWNGTIPNGESLDEVATRADRVIERARATDGDVALFAHGHILRILAARWCELAPVEGCRLPLETATLNVLGWEHEYPTLNIWNQH